MGGAAGHFGSPLGHRGLCHGLGTHTQTGTLVCFFSDVPQAGGCGG